MTFSGVPGSQFPAGSDCTGPAGTPGPSAAFRFTM